MTTQPTIEDGPILKLALSNGSNPNEFLAYATGKLNYFCYLYR